MYEKPVMVCVNCKHKWVGYWNDICPICDSSRGVGMDLSKPIQIKKQSFWWRLWQVLKGK